MDKNTDKELTHTLAYIRTNRLSCASCTYSRDKDNKLWCMFGDKPALSIARPHGLARIETKKCIMFEYEPGTDE